MRFFLFSLALPSLLASVVASPTPRNATVVRKRQETATYSTVAKLYADVKPHTAAINQTAASLSADSTTSDNATAAQAFVSNIDAITLLIQSAANDSLLSAAPTLRIRQASNSTLAEEVEQLILELSGTLDNIVGTLGLSPLLGSLSPLLLSLSSLLLSLENVVDNLLVVVKELLDGLLTGLSIGLSGLVV